jgi:hypothetical protein
MLDDRLDDLLRATAREHNQPPETPREEMWAAIQAVRRSGGPRAERGADGKEAKKRESRRRWPFRPSDRPTVRLVAGLAALLALGFALGRVSQTPAPPPQIASTPEPTDPATAYRVATMEHLSQSEAFLTLFRTAVRQGGNERLASGAARQLLATNRLLLDSPAAYDGRIRALLQDLELVFAQIAQLSPEPRARDFDLIQEDLEEGGVLSRLRTAVPSGAGTTQGAL